MINKDQIATVALRSPKPLTNDGDNDAKPPNVSVVVSSAEKWSAHRGLGAATSPRESQSINDGQETFLL
jgi:hypothetical protein